MNAKSLILQDYLTLNSRRNFPIIGGRVVLWLVMMLVPVSGGLRPSWAQTEGDLRLSNGTTEYEGRVEVYYDGEWGTVCDDHFTLVDAGVVCWQLGYGSALQAQGGPYSGLPVSPFGEGSGRIWLDNVNCDGTEARLIDCPRVGNILIGANNCNHREDAGVECETSTPTAPGILKSTADLTVAEGEEGTYTVVLTSAPTGEVTVTSLYNRTGIKVTPSTLTFTPDNWSEPQTVTVRALEDGNAASETVTIRYVSGGAYDYSGDGVVVRVDDDEAFPGSVSAPSVVASGPTTLDVSWLTPTDNETPVTDYDVHYRQSGASSWQGQAHSGTATHTTIRGLQADRTYEVQVRAKGSEGAGSWSPSGTGTTPQVAVPEKPPAPRVTAAGSATLVVRWTAPTDNGAPVTDYDVHYRQSGVSSWQVRLHSGTATQTTLTGLRASTEYEVQVRAGNRVGDGPWSESGTGATRQRQPAAPDAPTVGAGQEVATLDVSWTAPTDNGGVAIDYDVRYRQSGQQPPAAWREWLRSGTATHTSLTGLRAGTEYEVQVKAGNRGGYSRWSESGTGATAVEEAMEPVVNPDDGTDGGGDNDGGGWHRRDGRRDR